MGKGSGPCNDRPAVTISSMGPQERRVLLHGSEVDALLAEAVGIKAFKKSQRKRHKEMQTGEDVYEREVDKRPVLPYEVQNQLARISQDESKPPHERIKAKQALVFYNQRWVIAQAHASSFKGRGVEVNDLIQAGNEGLLEAVDQFEPERGNTFITYAKQKIFMRMQRLTENDSASIYGIRVPTDRYNEIGAVRRARTELLEILQREPTTSEMTEHINTHKFSGKDLTDERVEDAMRVVRNRPVSMQQTLRSDDGDDLELGHVIETSDRGPARETINQELTQAIDTAFAELDDQEKLILGTYYGYGNKEQISSMNKIADRYDMSLSAVQKIFRSGRAKLVSSFEKQGIASEGILIKE